jgi:hypothetical protein
MLSSGSGRALHYLVSAAVALAGFAGYATEGSTLQLVLGVALAVAYAVLPGTPGLVAGFTWCTLAAATSRVLPAPASLVAALLPHVYVRDVGGGRRGVLLTARLSVLPLVLSPAYVVRPSSLVAAVAYVVSLAAATTSAYLRLSRSNVRVGRGEFTAYLGEAVLVPVDVEVVGETYFTVSVDGSEVLRGTLGAGRTQLLVRLRPEVAGVRRYSIQLTLVDRWGLSRVSYGPYVVVVKAVPRSSEVVRRAREVLSAYVSASTPVVYVGRLGGVAGSAVGGGPGGGGGGRVGGGLDGVGGPRPAETSAVTAWLRFRWEVATRVLEALATSSRVFRGDYAGVREYTPGDHPRSIHWKKSVSIGELVVKVYESGGGEVGGSPALVVADWDASNPVELDYLIQVTYSALVVGRGRRYLYLILPSGRVYYVSGEALDVLRALDAVLLTEGVEARFNYEAPQRVGTRDAVGELGRVGGKLSLVDSYYRALAKALVDDAETRGIPRGSTYVLIHPKAYALRYTYLALELEARGYRGTSPRLLKPEEVAARLREAVAGVG